jgi:metal-responsive CopG/Arc/MetJ family transcriptional regulator
MGGLTQRTSISLPKELLEKGRLIAKKRRRNFSNYVADLIASDCMTKTVGSNSPAKEKTPKE